MHDGYWRKQKAKEENMSIFKKQMLALVVAAVLVFGMVPMCLAAGQVIKAVSAWPKTVYEVQNFMKFLEIAKQNVAAKAPGQLEIKYLGGPEVIPNSEQVEALRNGLVDMVFTTSGYYVSVLPVMDGLNLTTLTAGQEREKGINDFLNKLHNQKVNAHYLGRLGIGLPFMLFLNKKIEKADDLQGLKIRCSPTHIAFLKAMGAQPIVIPPPDVHTAIERGVVDGIIWVAGLIRDWGWHEVLKYRVEPGFYMGNNDILVNKDAWDKLPANLQKILQDSEIEAEKIAEARAADHLAKENAIMEKGGMKVIQLEGAEAKKLIDTAYNALWNVVIEKSGDDGRKLREMISN
jgi:TRAP-type C4-dicarboxylate transport system substrate-binding protein